MAQFYTNFSQYTENLSPSDWTYRASDTNTWKVVSSVLRDEETGFDGTRILTWNKGDATTEGEILTILETTNGYAGANYENQQNTLFLRASASSTYYCRIRALTDGNKYLTVGSLGTGGGVIADYAFNWLADTKYKVRFRVNGSTISAKIWDSTATEPVSWQISTTSTFISTSGWMGVGSYTVGGIRKFHRYGIATNGETAIMETVLSVSNAVHSHTATSIQSILYIGADSTSHQVTSAVPKLHYVITQKYPIYGGWGANIIGAFYGGVGVAPYVTSNITTQNALHSHTTDPVILAVKSYLSTEDSYHLHSATRPRIRGGILPASLELLPGFEARRHPLQAVGAAIGPELGSIETRRSTTDEFSVAAPPESGSWGVE